MSVNYYAFGPGITDPEGLHIGQYAVSSRFLMQSLPELGLTSLAAWMDFLRRPGVIIRAEHGLEASPDEMEETIRERVDSRGWSKQARIRRPYDARPGYHVDAEGVEFCELDFC
ncbi:hypothetical protein OG552_10740 [Streptomyces sp. NBC_01476]|uniref:hypothetical protein n=1 Tax=Streptomyces sp. NBC_01476 TaxID=2903881 RepID=UPI002E2F8D94|nr:hypothetical protein [Streptomyces sp. NBC_01476]